MKENASGCFFSEHSVPGGPAKVRPTYILPVTFGTWMYR